MKVNEYFWKTTSLTLLLIISFLLGLERIWNSLLIIIHFYLRNLP